LNEIDGNLGCLQLEGGITILKIAGKFRDTFPAISFRIEKVHPKCFEPFGPEYVIPVAHYVDEAEAEALQAKADALNDETGRCLNISLATSGESIRRSSPPYRRSVTRFSIEPQSPQCIPAPGRTVFIFHRHDERF
jgi:hypothetical protein